MSSTHSLPNARSGRQTLIRAYPSPRRIALLLEGIGGLAFLSWGVVILYGATHSATMNNKDQVALIEKISKAKLPDSSNGKFIAAPFKAADGAAWPAGKNIAFSHWSAGPEGQSFGHRQFCGDISGEALTTFINKYPAKDTQEPGLR